MPIDGTAIAAQLTQYLSGYTTFTLTPVFVYNNILVFSTEESNVLNQNFSSIEAINLANPLMGAKILVSTFFPTEVSVTGHSDDYVYYNIRTPGSSNLSGNIAGAVKTDGAVLRAITGANWVGYSFHTTMSAATGLSVNAMILDKYELDGTGIPTGGNISVYDAATDTLRNSQGKLPAGIVSFSGIGIGERVYGTFTNSSGSKYLAGLSVNIANSLKQLDLSTASVTDTPIM